MTTPNPTGPACRWCGCPPDEHTTRVEWESYGAWAQRHVVEECSCGECDQYAPCPDTSEET